MISLLVWFTKSTESILLTTEHFHYNYEIILFQKLSKNSMAGGRNQPNQRENDSDEDAELSDSEVNY